MPQLGLGNNLVKSSGVGIIGVPSPPDKLYYEFCHNYQFDYDLGAGKRTGPIIIPFSTEHEIYSDSVTMDGDDVSRLQLLLPFDSKLIKLCLRTEDVIITENTDQPPTLEFKVYECPDGTDEFPPPEGTTFLNNHVLRQTATMYFGWAVSGQAHTDEEHYKEINSSDLSPADHVFSEKSMISITATEVSPDLGGNFSTAPKDWCITTLWEIVP